MTADDPRSQFILVLSQFLAPRGVSYHIDQGKTLYHKKEGIALNANNDDDYLVQTLFLGTITLICLGVSWWSMTIGYESFMGSMAMAAAVSTVFVLMLAALNFTLRRGLIRGIGKGKITAILILYLLVVALSFSGMFNKFYSQFMESELIREELSEKIDLMVEIERTGLAVLTSEKSNAVRAKVKALQDELGREIRSQTEPGIGKKALNILSEIKNLLELDRGFRIYPTPNKTTAELNAIIELFNQDIDSALQKSEVLRRLNSPEKEALAKDLPQRAKAQISTLTSARNSIGAKESTVTMRANGLAALQAAVDEYKKIGREIESLVKDSNFRYVKYIRVKNDRIGEIPHTYESAREHMGRGVVWVAGAIALGIDLIVPIFVFFLTPRSGVSTGKQKLRGGPRGLQAEH